MLRYSRKKAKVRRLIEDLFCGLSPAAASANVPVARKRSVSSHTSLLFMVLPALHVSAMGMPQKDAFEKLIFEVTKAGERLILATGE
jgi:hypothetical protein